MRVDPSQPRKGQIEETANPHPGTLDLPPFEPVGTANSFFDVFAQIMVGGQTLHPGKPLHLASVITHKPPGPGEAYMNLTAQGPIPLLDAKWQPTGILLVSEMHTPN